MDRFGSKALTIGIKFWIWMWFYFPKLYSDEFLIKTQFYEKNMLSLVGPIIIHRYLIKLINCQS